MSEQPVFQEICGSLAIKGSWREISRNQEEKAHKVGLVNELK